MDVVGIGVTDVADADVDVVEVGVAGKDAADAGALSGFKRCFLTGRGLTRCLGKLARGVGKPLLP